MTEQTRTESQIGEKWRNGTACESCRTSYDRCTASVLDGDSPCCPACGSRDTHDEQYGRLTPPPAVLTREHHTPLGACLRVLPGDMIPDTPDGTLLLVIGMADHIDPRMAEVALDPDTITWLRSALPEQAPPPAEAPLPHGAECYRRAVRLAEQVEAGERTPIVLPLAQVYATLAQAAATVEAVGSRGPGDVDALWRPVLAGEAHQ